MKIDLRKKHPRFIYEDFAIKKLGRDLKIAFKFKIPPNIYFNPEITVKNVKQAKINALAKETIDNLAFHLGLMEIPSYWKATCSPEIIIKAGFLSKEQIQWWQDLLLNGMGQFYYTNKIDFRKKDFLKIKVCSAKKFNFSNQKFNPNRILVPIGGGKDSLVTWEILKKAGYKTIPFLLNPVHNPIKSAENIIQEIGSKEAVILQRKIDPKLFALNKAGYLNGHTPIVALISFASLLAAVFSDSGAVATSNERSAEEGNLVFLGYQINHQYDKTWKFEKDFVSYLEKYLIPKVKFFSLLRPLYELQIAKLFSRYPQYFSLFKSCNVGQKTASWCCQCPKCISTFVLLYPFLKEGQLVKIFGKNLLKESSLLPILKALMGKSGHKPFECVPTFKETRAALYPNLKKAQKRILASWSNKHNIPQELARILKEKLKHDP